MPLRRVREPFDDPAWLYELKLDGFRALAHVDGAYCRLVSWNGHNFKAWPALCAAIATNLRAESAVLDGELVCLDDDGKPDFRALPFRRAEPVFYVFDVLMLDGRAVCRSCSAIRRSGASSRAARSASGTSITSSAGASSCSGPSASWTWRASSRRRATAPMMR